MTAEQAGCKQLGKGGILQGYTRPLLQQFVATSFIDRWFSSGAFDEQGTYPNITSSRPVIVYLLRRVTNYTPTSPQRSLSWLQIPAYQNMISNLHKHSTPLDWPIGSNVAPTRDLRLRLCCIITYFVTKPTDRGSEPGSEPFLKHPRTSVHIQKMEMRKAVPGGGPEGGLHAGRKGQH